MAVSLNPIVVKELRSRMRGPRTFVILSILLVGLAAVCYAVLSVFEGQARAGAFIMSAQVGKALFAALALAETLLITFLTPAVSAGAISSEREQLTYDLLVATPLRPGRILSGKLIGTLSYILLLIFAAVPLGSLVLVFGGVAPEELLQALVLMLVTALTFGMIGLLCSALVRRTITATILAYAIVLLMIAGSYFAVALGTAAHPNQTPAPSRLVALSPFSAMVSIVAQGMQPGGGAVTMPALGMAMPDAPVPGVAVEGLIRPMPMPPMMDGAGPGLIMNMPGLSMLSMGLVEFGPNGPVMLPMYRWTIVGYALLGLGCYWVASHLVRPRRRWRLDRHDLLMLGTVVVVAGLGTQWLGLSSVLRGRLGL